MIEIIEPGWPAPPNVGACFTTRRGGVSAAPYDSCNLGLHVGDDEASVRANRAALRGQLELPAEPAWLRQTHGIDVVLLECDQNRDADAAVTRSAGQVAAVMVADCLPILLCSRHGDEVAVAHAGWRGLQRGVIGATLEAMQTSAAELMAWIGPGISQANFEVGDEVRTAFGQVFDRADEYFIAAPHRGHWLCDLAGLAERELESRGVGAVYRDPRCSFGEAELFYSYRRDATTGRMAGLIWIK